MSFPISGWTLSKKLDSSQPVLSLLQNQALGPGGGDKGLSGTPGRQVASRNTGRPCVLDWQWVSAACCACEGVCKLSQCQLYRPVWLRNSTRWQQSVMMRSHRLWRLRASSACKGADRQAREGWLVQDSHHFESSSFGLASQTPTWIQRSHLHINWYRPISQMRRDSGWRERYLELCRSTVVWHVWHAWASLCWLLGRSPVDMKGRPSSLCWRGSQLVVWFTWRSPECILFTV